MTTLTMPFVKKQTVASPKVLKQKRIESIDLLRGIVMIIMALDHVRDYFHRDAFLFDPTNLDRTNVILFFTRFITHYCAPVFVFLAGVSAYLYGSKRTIKQLSWYLFSRGLWLVFAELFIIVLGRTFNPTFPLVNLQVIWAIGISMMVLSGLVYMRMRYILLVAVVLIAGHNILDNVHVPGTGAWAFFWSILHEPKEFAYGRVDIFVQYPLLPWMGLMAFGYYLGQLYAPGYDREKRRNILLYLGSSMLVLFFFLRCFNLYGDVAPWSIQKNYVFNLMSLINVTKYPPSLLYILVTIGPALILLDLIEKPLNKLTQKISVYGRVPFFYYVVHIYLIHVFAMIAAKISGYKWSDMILKTKVYRTPELKGYGFNLLTTYLLWIGLVLLLYPMCKWFDTYKRKHQATKYWLTYL